MAPGPWIFFLFKAGSLTVCTASARLTGPQASKNSLVSACHPLLWHRVYRNTVPHLALLGMMAILGCQ